MITVRVLLFGHLREFAPPSGLMLELLPSATVAAAANALSTRDVRFSDLLTRGRVAVNADFADADTPLSDGDELAFLPPMSGG